MPRPKQQFSSLHDRISSTASNFGYALRISALSRHWFLSSLSFFISFSIDYCLGRTLAAFVVDFLNYTHTYHYFRHFSRKHNVDFKFSYSHITTPFLIIHFVAPTPTYLFYQRTHSSMPMATHLRLYWLDYYCRYWSFDIVGLLSLIITLGFISYSHYTTNIHFS
jgi:hypothetical protein